MVEQIEGAEGVAQSEPHVDEGVAVEEAEAERVPEGETVYFPPSGEGRDGCESQHGEEGDVGVWVAGEAAEAMGGGLGGGVRGG